MERQEAAEFLGVSISTLDRLASQGRLTRGRARRKTRPVTVYDPQELERLKAELATESREVFRRLNTTEKPRDAVGFRLDPYYVKLLKQEGDKLGLSPGEYARRLVIRSLESTSEDKFAQELAALRNGLSGMFYLILVQKFGATEDEANAVVNAISR